MIRKALAWLLCIPLLAGARAGAAAPGRADLPADSLYRITPLQLRDQDGARFDLASLRGRPVVLGMFYASCQVVCPLQIETLKRLQRALPHALPVVLISFDPAHDGVARLHAVAAEHRVRAPAFRLARLEHGDLDALGAVLGIAWRALPGGGGYSHNVVFNLLDRDGRIAARSDKQDGQDADFVAAAKAMFAAQ
ncbi:MAG: SCO family protein [Xanthomonadaceae bacterium]|nr:SCO family protein [Xanthomonadaceae bacterium]MDE1961655.1 SCO family protein [Xanthomonadaceae bacterium]MDE2084734.1 SCO family protein [Xanthomonadaceae bacterium]MDE2258128.1 SCO family protein [Xanthomonadaceae bacterium]